MKTGVVCQAEADGELGVDWAPFGKELTVRTTRAAILLTIVIPLFGSIAVEAQTPAAVSIHVRETAGIRRTRYPVNARVPFPRGVLKDAAQARLTLDNGNIEAQIAAETKHADGSIQWLAVDFNASLGPIEEQTYRLEYGDGVNAPAAGRGVAVGQNANTIQIGRIRLNKSDGPLLGSLNYRKEILALGMNGFAVTDSGGTTLDLSKAESITTEIVKPGQLYAVVRYSGRLAIDGRSSTPFTITVEMPNSKAWVKYTARVEDPTRSLRQISFHTPFAFSAFPWLWDFGTGSWTYGSIRSATDSVILTQAVKSGGTSRWEIRTGPKGQEQPYEVAAGARARIAEGWGHFQDSSEVVAFGFDAFGRQPGTYTITLDGQGQNFYRFAPEQPATWHQIAIYQHYVGSPAQIGAVTSPASMLNPLIFTCDREQYVKAGVPAPASTRVRHENAPVRLR